MRLPFARKRPRPAPTDRELDRKLSAAEQRIKRLEATADLIRLERRRAAG
jgi:hypothetical protein